MQTKIMISELKHVKYEQPKIVPEEVLAQPKWHYEAEIKQGFKALTILFTFI